MLCKIADLFVEVPLAGDLFPRCREYLSNEKFGADIILRTEQFRSTIWKDTLSYNDYIYLESGIHFYSQLLAFGGLMLHSSAVELNGKAYLFSGDCGVGKSTHTQLWKNVFGSDAKVFNDDKPALRYVDGKWFAYGTPWCGKDGININMKVPLAGLCFLKQSDRNHIQRLDSRRATQLIIQQTTRRFGSLEPLNLLLMNIDKLISVIPVFELENRPEPEAVLLSYNTMLNSAEEKGL